LPREITDIEEFIQLSNKAMECRVRRSGKLVKLKLRTGKGLYTIKLDSNKAEQVLEGLNCEITEI
jgi:hypothetical protein